MAFAANDPADSELPDHVAAQDTRAEPARILVVDDDRNNLVALNGLLEDLADEVVFARSGEEALRLILRMDFAVILMDVLMPGIDGYETAAIIRSRRRSRRIPIIFLTAANRDDVHMFRGYSAGAVDFVFKPVEPLILRSKISVFVDLHRKTQEMMLKAEYERRLLIENLRSNADKLAAEQALRRSEERQAMIMRSLPIALYTADPDRVNHQPRFIGEAIGALSGFDSDYFTAAKDAWSSRLHPEDRARVLAEFQHMRESGACAVEYRWLCRDDRYRAFLDQAVLVPGQAGRPDEIVGSLLDITERRNIQQQLVHAQKMDAIGKLTGGIAHDFNNMLTVVIGSLDRLRRTVNGNPDALRRTDMALHGALRCADLTQRLLAFARKQPLAPKIIDLNGVVSGVEAMFRRLIGDTISLEIRKSEGLWATAADPTEMESALVNLVINARDAMPEGGRLIVETGNFTGGDSPGGGPPGEYVSVSVSDTGRGIPSEMLDRVFEPFFTTKQAGDGTGLGLSIIYGFVHQSGGHVDIKSEVGKGTTVRLLLPRSIEKVTPAESTEVEAMPRGNGEAVLVVEDDDDVRFQASSLLVELGYRVMEAADGVSALERLRSSNDVAVLFTDIAMPGRLNGIELAGEAQRLVPAIRILFVSGNPQFAKGIKHTIPSETVLLRKPYRDFDLARAVRNVLSAPPLPIAEEYT